MTALNYSDVIRKQPMTSEDTTHDRQLDKVKLIMWGQKRRRSGTEEIKKLSPSEQQMTAV